MIHAYVPFSNLCILYSNPRVSPFELVFGKCAHKPLIPSKVARDLTYYQHQLQAKLSQLMEAHNIKASNQQKQYFDKQTLAIELSE